MDEASWAPLLAAKAAKRTRLLADALGEVHDSTLRAPSRLPGWSRLHVICHLRYGAAALCRMTAEAQAGRPTAYYPDGRERQRPATLVPQPGEEPRQVIDDLRALAGTLDSAWASISDEAWSLPVAEPPDNPDLGTVPLARLPLARALEVDVHGTDLGIGFPEWDPLLIEAALPTRLAWLSTRRTNHRPYDGSIRTSWLLVGNDELRWFVEADRDVVRSRPALQGDAPDFVIAGSNRDLLALLLGRERIRPLEVDPADADVAFSRAFPGP